MSRGFEPQRIYYFLFLFSPFFGCSSCLPGGRWRDGDVGEDAGAAAEFSAAQQVGRASKDGAQCSLRYSRCLLEPRAFLKLLAAVS